MDERRTEDRKRRAKRLAREGVLTHQQALDKIARGEGCTHWGSLLQRFSPPTPADSEAPLANFFGYRAKKAQDYHSLQYLSLHEGLTAAQHIERVLTESKPIVDKIVAGSSCSKRHLIDSRGDFGDYEGSPDIDDLRSAITMLEKHIHAATQITRVFNMHFFVAEGIIDELAVHIRLHGSIYWTSSLRVGEITHFMEATGMPFASYLPDLPECWQAAHNYVQTQVERSSYRDSDRYELAHGFNPIDLGFEPCGLYMPLEVTGVRYQVRPIHREEVTQDLSITIAKRLDTRRKREATRGRLLIEADEDI